MALKNFYPRTLVFLFGIFVFLFQSASAHAADRSRIETFLKVTGFDVALDSIALSAESAPGIIGLDVKDFGPAWRQISKDVFALDDMRDQALDYLESALSEDALEHAEEFYATELGQRLVKAENAAHLVEDDETKFIAGERIISDLVKTGDARIEILKRMGRAVNVGDTAVTAIQEVQFRFVMAATAVGMIELQLEPEALKELMAQQERDIRLNIEANNLTSSAYAYQGFSNGELEAYSDALETPQMQEVYRLLNAVQFEITASRYETLAYRLAKIGVGEDI